MTVNAGMPSTMQICAVLQGFALTSDEAGAKITAIVPIARVAPSFAEASILAALLMRALVLLTHARCDGRI